MRRLIIALAGLALCGNLWAQDAPRSKVCLGSFRSEGLDAAAARAFRDKLVEAIEAKGAELAPLPKRAAKNGPDFKDARCAERGLEELGVQGVLTAQLFRLGPLVRVKLSAKDSGSGAPLGETQISASSAGFPGSVELGGELEQLLAKLPPPEPPRVAVATNDPSDPPPPPPPPPPPTTTNPDDPEPATDPEIVAEDDATEGEGSAATVIGFGGLGLGGLLLAGGAVVGGMTLAMDQDLRSVCRDGNCPSDRQDDIEQLNTLAWTTNGLLGAGVLVVAVSAVALVMAGD